MIRQIETDLCALLTRLEARQKNEESVSGFSAAGYSHLEREMSDRRLINQLSWLFCGPLWGELGLQGPKGSFD